MAARGRYAHDRGLTVRMAVAMAVLGLEFALFRPILARMFDTHPPLERRLAELDKVREQLSRDG
jgi:Zn-dependent protease with chaperone function